MMKNIALFLTLILISFSCKSLVNEQADGANITDQNPPAEGFNFSESDEKAIQIADEVMEAMGGRKAWDDTRCLEWNFFGFRKLTGDKKEYMVKVDYMKEDQQVVMNINTMQGTVKKNGLILQNPDSVKKYVDKAYRVWINDSYWLIMPYKLKDSGVTLKYIGSGNTENGREADILQLTFNGVGVTPQNKYHVWVDKESKMVSQWAYFKNADQEEPDFTDPWLEYEMKGSIMLSGNRGERQITDITVYNEMSPDLFVLSE